MTKRRTVEATAPARIDLAGGTLDIWPLNLMFQPSMTVNMAVTIMAKAVVEPRKDRKVILASEDQGIRVEFGSLASVHHDHKLGLVSRLVGRFAKDGGGFTVTTSGQSPAGAGLGGSSSLAIALCSALSWHTGARMNKAGLLNIAKDVEAAHLGIPTGLQDYLAALYGGANVFHFPAGGFVRERISPDMSTQLENRIALFYSGASRSSGINNWEMFRLVMEKDKKTVRLFGRIAEHAREASSALAREDFPGFTKAVKEEWATRKKLFPSISTPAIDSAMKAGFKAGAEAARICGAGGGGCFFMIAPEGLMDEAAGAVEKAGAQRLSYRISRAGVKASAQG